MPSQGIDTTIIIAGMVLLVLLVIWLLSRSGSKPTSAFEDQEEESPLFAPDALTLDRSLQMDDDDEEELEKAPARSEEWDQISSVELERCLIDLEAKIGQKTEPTMRMTAEVLEGDNERLLIPAQQAKSLARTAPASTQLIRAEVSRLTASGSTVVEIAEALNLTRDEVELALLLHQRKVERVHS